MKLFYHNQYHHDVLLFFIINDLNNYYVESVKAIGSIDDS